MAGTKLRASRQARVDWWRSQFQRQRKANLNITDLPAARRQRHDGVSLEEACR